MGSRYAIKCKGQDGEKYILHAAVHQRRCMYVWTHLLCLCKNNQTSMAMESVEGRILRSLPVFCPSRIYTLYLLLPFSVDKVGPHNALLLAWKKENSHVVNCIGGTQAARTWGNPLEPWATPGQQAALKKEPKCYNPKELNGLQRPVRALDETAVLAVPSISALWGLEWKTRSSAQVSGPQKLGDNWYVLF